MDGTGSGAVRLWLAKEVKLLPESDAFAALWEAANEEEDGRLIDFAVDAEGRADLLRFARRFLARAQRVMNRPAASTPRRSVALKPRFDEYETERMWAWSEFLARLATTQPGVRRFRADVLDGRVLSPTEATTLVHSPAAQHLMLLQFRQSNIPVIGHTARLVTEEGFRDRGWLCYQATLFSDPPGITTTVERRTRRPFAHYAVLDVASQGEGEGQIEVWRGSILDDLRQASAHLIRTFPWTAGQAAWFLLTDEPPLVLPIQGSLASGGTILALEKGLTKRRHDSAPDEGVAWNYATITLSVASWVSAERVAQVYREARRQVNAADSRAPEPHNAAVFRFVTARRGANLELTKTWRELAEEWDRAQPDSRRRYGGRWRQFARDYVRAEQALLSQRPPRREQGIEARAAGGSG
jgi:hypothetical protein